MRSYCIKEKRETDCVPNSEQFVTTKNGRLMMKCICASCGVVKTRFMKSSEGKGIASTIADTGLEMFIQHGIPWLGKKSLEIARYAGSEALRNKKVRGMITNKAKKLSHKGLDYMLDNLSGDIIDKASDKLRPAGYKKGGNIDYSDWYPMSVYSPSGVNDPTNPLYQRGEGIPLPPFPFVYWKKAWNVVRAPGLFKPPQVSKKEGMAIVAEYKRQYKAYKDAGGSRSYNSWIKWKGYGGGLDIHNAILKIAPKKGFVMPGHRYTGPGNPLEEQLRYDPNTGEILEIYQQPTGRTDAVSMQHDVDYSVCGRKPKGDQLRCKNEADRKMIKSLDAIPWNQRQWGHAIARNAIAGKAKLGLGVSKNGKGRRVKTGKRN